MQQGIAHSHFQSPLTMNTEKSATLSRWSVDRVRGALLNGPSPGQDIRPQLQTFLKLKTRTQVIRQLAAGEQAKLLEIIDQVSIRCYHPPLPGFDQTYRS